MRRMSSLSTATTNTAFQFAPANRLKTFLGPTVWHKITPLAQKYGAINLGQGFPGFSPPAFVRETLSKVVTEQDGVTYLANQYARSQGDMSLVKTLAEQYTRRLDRTIDHLTEVAVCNGATGVIFNITQSLLNEGDGVVVFEPAFDIYAAQSAMAGATVRYVPMHMREVDGKYEWSYNPADLRAALNENTRMIILNTPHNPTGKVFSRAELVDVCAALAPYPKVVVVADEVYQHLIFEGEHHHIAAIKAEEYQHLVPEEIKKNIDVPDMWTRTLSVCSSGKTLACTGWKIGWCVGPSHLVSCVTLANSWVTFSVHTPSQVAVGKCLHAIDEVHTNYYNELVEGYRGRLDKLTSLFDELRVPYARPQGSFFLVIDVAEINIPEKYLSEQPTRDWAFSVWAIEEGGVATIPCSVFYCEEDRHIGANLVRVAFAQRDEVMDEAVTRLRKLLA